MVRQYANYNMVAVILDQRPTAQRPDLDGMARRMKKAVTNPGDHDATVLYLCNGDNMIDR
jgi:hypothetical protein